MKDHNFHVTGIFALALFIFALALFIFAGIGAFNTITWLLS